MSPLTRAAFFTGWAPPARACTGSAPTPGTGAHPSAFSPMTPGPGVRPSWRSSLLPFASASVTLSERLTLTPSWSRQDTLNRNFDTRAREDIFVQNNTRRYLAGQLTWRAMLPERNRPGHRWLEHPRQGDLAGYPAFGDRRIADQPVASGLEITGLTMRFADGSQTRVIQPGANVTAMVTMSYRNVGLLQARWELATPVAVLEPQTLRPPAYRLARIPGLGVRLGTAAMAHLRGCALTFFQLTLGVG